MNTIIPKVMITILALITLNSCLGSTFKVLEDPTVFKALGGWASGGGNAVVCFKEEKAENALRLMKANGGVIGDQIIGDIKFIEMYDGFEARLPRGLNQEIPEIISIKSDESIKDYVYRIAERFNLYVPSVSQNIYAGMNAIPDSNIRFSPSAVKQVQDIDTVISSVDEKLCGVTTMAIQRNFNGYYNLYIDERLFNHPGHSKQSKAVLLLHEYLYTQARARKEENSASTREVVGMAISRHSDLTVEYAAFMVHNLDFGWEKVPEGFEVRPHIYYSALVDMAIYRLSNALKAASAIYRESSCVKCEELYNLWNKEFPQEFIPAGSSFGNFYIHTYLRMNNPLPSSIANRLYEAKLEITKMIQDKLKEEEALIKSSLSLIPASREDRVIAFNGVMGFLNYFKYDPFAIITTPDGVYNPFFHFGSLSRRELINHIRTSWYHDGAYTNHSFALELDFTETVIP